MLNGVKMRAAATFLSAYFAFALLLGVRPADAQQIEGRVVSIADGDTLTILTPAKKQIRIRLAEIDAPESNQPWGQRAKQALSSLVFSKPVTITDARPGPIRPHLGRVYVNGKYVNAEMVRSGDAWAYREYLTDYSLISLETEARKDHRGLWSLAAGQTVAPWDWRRNGRTQRTVRQSLPQVAGQCGTKRYCRQMTSCAEARFYLNQCGVSSLDGDGDGVPCETICR